MAKAFAPEINRQLFTKIILAMQENEGSETCVVKTIAARLELYKDLYFYDAFLNVLREFRIGFEC